MEWVVDVGIPTITLVGGWAGSSVAFRHKRRTELAAIKQKQQSLDDERIKVTETLDTAKEQYDRALMEKALELCRGTDKEAAQGRALLKGLASMGSTNPRLIEVLNEVTQLEVGKTVAEIAAAKAAPELEGVVIIEEVVVSYGDAEEVESHDDERTSAEASDGDQGH